MNSINLPMSAQDIYYGFTSIVSYYLLDKQDKYLCVNV